MPEWDIVTDFVSVGSGVGGLVGRSPPDPRVRRADHREAGSGGGLLAKSGGTLYIPTTR